MLLLIHRPLWLIWQQCINENIKIMNDKKVDFLMTSDIVGVGSSFGLEKKFHKCFNEVYNLYEKVII